jgi:hypothetical protein
MKTLKISLAALFISAVSFAQTAELKSSEMAMTKAVDVVKAAEVKWGNETHDFGDIEKGKPVTHSFTFTNTSKETVLITNVKPSCGCTAANYTKTPIKPGEKGSVEATFNAAAPGNFQKTITVTTNQEGAAPKVLIIKGNVATADVEK